MGRWKADRKRLLLLPAGLALVLSHVGCQETAAGETPAIARSFTLSTDPEVEVLKVTYVGGLSGDRDVFTLYGDGHLRHEAQNRAGVVERSGSVNLSQEATRGLISHLVEAGLIDIDEERIWRKIRAHGRPGQINDAGVMILTVRLASYTRDGVTTRNVEKSFTQRAARFYHSFFPAVTELGGLVELTDALLASRDLMSYELSRVSG